MVCRVMRGMWVGCLAILFSVNAASEVSLESLEEVHELLKKDLIGYSGCIDIVSKFYMIGSPVKSHSNCCMTHHPKSKGFSKEDVENFFYLFENLQPGANSNVVALGSFTYIKTEEDYNGSKKPNRISIKVERSEL